MSEAAANAAAGATGIQERMSALMTFIMHHVTNSHEWTPLPGIHPITLPPFLSLHGLMLLFCAFLLVFSLLRFRKHSPAPPSGFANLLEFFVVFIRDQIAIPNLGEKDGLRMTPLLCSFFFFILVMNLIGLVPCFATPTGNVNVTAALALVSLSFMIFGAAYRNGLLAFIKGFIPHGVPWPVLIIVVPVEILGMFIKAMALTIRLFANMFAGHIVIFALLGLFILFGYIALIPAMAMAVGIYFLEIFVAFLQAFIFTMLSAVFIGQRYHPEH